MSDLIERFPDAANSADECGMAFSAETIRQSIERIAELESEVARLRMDWHRLEFLNKNMRIQMATSVETRLYIDLPVATSFRAAIDAAKEQS